MSTRFVLFLGSYPRLKRLYTCSRRLVLFAEHLFISFPKSSNFCGLLGIVEDITHSHSGNIDPSLCILKVSTRVILKQTFGIGRNVGLREFVFQSGGSLCSILSDAGKHLMQLKHQTHSESRCLLHSLDQPPCLLLFNLLKSF